MSDHPARPRPRLRRPSSPFRAAIALGALVHLGAAGAGAQPLDDTVLDDFVWRSIGPSATGGRIVDLAVRADRPSTLYVASASGGLWRSLNNGTTWTCIFQNEGTISIGDIALDPGNPDVIWVGTGEANNQRSSYWGDGVYKSTDGGATWTNMGLRDSHHIGRIVVHPSNSDTVYVAALGHLYTSNRERGLYKTIDGGRTWERVLAVSPEVGVADVVLDPNRPDTVYAASYERLRRAWHFDGAGPGSAIHKSTDGGRTWRRLEGGLPTGEIGRIGLDIFPSNSDILYATVSNQNQVPVEEDGAPAGPREPDLGFAVEYRTEAYEIVSVDEGSAAAEAGIETGDRLVTIGGTDVTDFWRLIGALHALEPGQTVEIVLARDGMEVTVELVVPPPAGPTPRMREVGGEIYRTDDAGETWTKVNEQPVGGFPPYYYGQIRVDPTDENRVYVLSIPLFGSTDGGKTFSSTLARGIHVDHHAMWIDPANPDHVILGNDGGLHVTWDRCETWDFIFNLPLSQFYAVGFDYQRPYHVYGGLQDNGSWGGPSQSRNPSGVGRFDWYVVGGGDGFYVEVQPDDPNWVYAESQFGGLTRWNRRTGSGRSIRPPRSDEDGPDDRYNWMSPLVISHHNPQIIYFGGNKLFKSYDRGDRWHVISPDLTTADEEKIRGNVPHCTITTVAESPIDHRRLLVGTDDGNVQWSDDGGATWTNMADRFDGVPPNYWVSRVELSRHAADTAFVAFTGYREDDFRPFLYMTRNAGRNWDPIMSNLPMGPVNVIREDTVNPNVLYVGTEFGVFISIDGGGRWTELAGGLPTVAVHDLKVHPRDRDLIAATHGRGIFILDHAPLQELSAEVLAKPFHLFSIENAVQWRFVFGAGISGDRKLMAPNPPYGASIAYFLKADVEPDALSLRVIDAAGAVVRTLDVNPAAGLHRMQWDLRRDREQDADGDDQTRRGRFGRGRGAPAVEPGAYTVVLTLGEESIRQTIVVEADPIDE